MLVSKICDKKLRSTTGQALLLSILALGGVVLSATTIAGLVMTYQIRQTTEAADSAEAVFAADAGIECGLYRALKSGSCPLGSGAFSNDARYEVTVNDRGGSVDIVSKGSSRNSWRSFRITLE